ncbi:MAG: MIP/aquaporin family protein [Tepidiformaceae bacterium]
MSRSPNSDLMSREFLDKWGNPLLAEALGTFALIFFGAGSIIMTQNGDLVAIALAHGLAIGLMVMAAGHISGGLYNPALTLGLWVARKFDAKKTALYIVAELIGAVIAALLLKAMFPSAMTDTVKLGVPAVGTPFTTGQALLAEIVTSFFLMYVVFGNAIDPRGKNPSSGLMIGLTITMGIFATGAVSGAAMNPARWFGPALAGNIWTDGWIWIVGPIVGAALGALVYAYIHLDPAEAGPKSD